MKKLAIADYKDAKDINRQKFLARLSNEIGKRGVIDVLRKGVDHGPLHFDLFYGTPSPGNAKAAALSMPEPLQRHAPVALQPGRDAPGLDLCLFINGLPIATFELKNSLTKQTVEDAIEQYRRDRDPREKLFEFGRCVVHFAVDDAEVRMCTELRGKASWFLPFNKGWNDGAGNPPNPDGLKTDYLWKEVLTPAGLTNILENYAQIVEEKNAKDRAGRSASRFSRATTSSTWCANFWPTCRQHGAGRRYLIQHSAGSGKSNSIAWLAHQLIGVEARRQGGFRLRDRRDRPAHPRRPDSRDDQAVHAGRRDGGPRRTFRRPAEVHRGGQEDHHQHGAEVPVHPRRDREGAKGRTFAIIIDEAHSSQGGKTSAAMSAALADPEDTVNDALEKRMQARKMLTNASYFAFTATPKNKTLEMFGQPLPPDAEGKVKHRPFHSYTMKQAIQEGFILDVLKSYTPVDSYYKLVKKIEGDPEFDTKRAQKKLRKYVESHDHAIRLKAEIMVDHFHEQVMALNKIGGKARAMVVCSGIERAIQYFHAFKAYLAERKSPYQAIVAFSGEHEYGGAKVTESSLNGFPSGDIADKIQEDPYRFLICADKFQTGYDEPLLHTMYVDKPLSGIKAVQTLSRLNRAHPEKHDVFVLDFQNNAETITEAFADYYRTTVLSEETDPNKLHDLKAALDNAQVYSPEQVQTLVDLFLSGAERDKLDPILDTCVAVYKERLDEDGQVDFKGKAKAFARTYDFLASVLPYTNREWEKLSIVLNFLIPKLPAPKEEDLSKGILEAIDMDSYRVEKKAAMKIALAGRERGDRPGAGRRRRPQARAGTGPAEQHPQERSTIISARSSPTPTAWPSASGKTSRRKVAADPAYQNAKKNTPNTARIEHDKALAKVMLTLLKDDTQVYKQFVENESFRRFVTDMVYTLTNE